ncbi:Protein trichome birefringence [Rhynchospora pubera]|uniref:Protein trichome birefringence n=1 Tax=Rhynchospora pubera TaxID=906938 RepID=A0AAV8EZR8_9POAL|nr:Protein trichome birefringence [Rhynchospora pubera]
MSTHLTQTKPKMAFFKNLPREAPPPSFAAITALSVTLLFFFLTFSSRAPPTLPPVIFNPQLVISFYDSSGIPTLSAPQSDPLDATENGEDGIQEERNGDVQSCVDLFDGMWVLDDSLPSYLPGSCPFIDAAFDCQANGRRDANYTKLRWQPKGCTLPRMDGKTMLEFLRGKRLAFVGDSLNRNMWESLVCMLRNSLTNKSTVFEASGRREFKAESFYSFIFTEYNCSIEFFRSPFLVQQWEIQDSSGRNRETLRLDKVDNSSEKYRDADIIVFNSGHWWTHEKTSKGLNYYQEGDKVHPQMSSGEAYRKALTTWARWIDANIDPDRTQVVFRGYSWTHYSGGQWNSGGSCDGEIQPITDERHLAHYPALISILDSILLEMKTPVLYLNITRMTDYRKDGHPSVYRYPEKERKQNVVQDCSHWCLPGVPDSWNELLYAMLLQRLGSEIRSVQSE